MYEGNPGEIDFGLSQRRFELSGFNRILKVLQFKYAKLQHVFYLFIYFLMQTNTGTQTELFSTGRHLEPTIATLPSGELILCRDDMSIIADSEGKKTQKQTLTWSDTPTALGKIRPGNVTIQQ